MQCNDFLEENCIFSEEKPARFRKFGLAAFRASRWPRRRKSPAGIPRWRERNRIGGRLKPRRRHPGTAWNGRKGLPGTCAMGGAGLNAAPGFGVSPGAAERNPAQLFPWSSNPVEIPVTGRLNPGSRCPRRNDFAGRFPAATASKPPGPIATRAAGPGLHVNDLHGFGR